MQSIDTLEESATLKPCLLVKDEASYIAEYGAKLPTWTYTSDWTACPVTCEAPTSQTRVKHALFNFENTYYSVSCRQGHESAP